MPPLPSPDTTADLSRSHVDASSLKQALQELGVDNFEKTSDGGLGVGGLTMDFLVDPGLYREVEEAVRTFAG